MARLFLQHLIYIAHGQLLMAALAAKPRSLERYGNGMARIAQECTKQQFVSLMSVRLNVCLVQNGPDWVVGW